MNALRDISRTLLNTAMTLQDAQRERETNPMYRNYKKEFAEIMNASGSGTYTVTDHPDGGVRVEVVS